MRGYPARPASTTAILILTLAMIVGAWPASGAGSTTRGTGQETIGAGPPSPSPAQDPPFGNNVRVVDDAGSAGQWEVDAEVNKRGALVASWVDLRSGEQCGYSSSRDGGITWQANALRKNPSFNIAADPVVVADDDGDFYILCMSVASGYNGGVLEVSRSTDDGATWGPWVPFAYMASGGFPDKPWMAASGSGKLYVAWEIYLSGSSYTRVQFSRSLDHGATWSAPMNLSAGGSWAELGVGIDTDTAGSVFLSYAGYNQLPVKFQKSADGGATFSPAVTIGTNTQQTTISSLAADPGGQYLYVAWNSAYNPEGIWFARSTDGGATWSSPFKLSTNGLKISLDVDPAGTLHAIWEEDGGGGADVWYANSTDHGATFSSKVRVPDQSSGCGSGTSYGSYEAIAADQQGRLYAWWCDDRNGNADIYFAKTAPSNKVTRIEVTPANATVPADQTQQFSARAFDQNNKQVNATFAWSGSGGSVDQGGLYTPGPAGTFTVTASAQGVSGSAGVQVVHGALQSVAVSPVSATITADQTLQFSCEGVDSKGNRWKLAGVQWVLSGGAGAGTIDAAGLYRPDKAGTYAVECADPASGKKGSASVTVISGAVASVEVDPATASITADDTQQFTATAADARGNPVSTNFAWGAQGGNVSGGLYSPTKAGTWTVTATVGGKSGIATVEVAPGALARIDVAPAAKTISADETLQLSAKGYDSEGNERPLSISWSVDTASGGAISPSGAFEPVKVGAWTVKAKEGSVEGSAKVTVTTGKLATLRMEPASAMLDKGRKLTFTLALEDAKRNQVTAETTTWDISGDDLGGFDEASATLTARNAGEATYKVTVEAAGVVRSAESRVLVSGGPLDTKGGGQLYTLLVAILLVVVSLAAALALAVGKRRRGRTAQQTMMYQTQPQWPAPQPQWQPAPPGDPPPGWPPQ